MIDLSKAAKLLNGTIIGPNQIHCADPYSDPRKRNMSVWVHVDGRIGVHCFRHGVDRIYCVDYVKNKLGLEQSLSKSKLTVNTTVLSIDPYEQNKKRTEWALKLWSARQPIQGSLAEKYLASRNLTLTKEVLRGGSLAFHPAVPFKVNDDPSVYLPTMLALFTDAKTGEPKGIHRTALKPDGSGKSDHPGLGNPKRMLGDIRGCVIRLSPDEEVTQGLGLCEGIETGLSILIKGRAPIWVAGSASNIKRFPIITGIGTITVWADNDENSTGELAGDECAERYSKAGIEAIVRIAPVIGTDHHDMITGGAGYE